MDVTKLTDVKPIGKVKSGVRHPIKGSIRTISFQSVQEFTSILYSLSHRECLTIGLFEDNYSYVPSSDLDELSKPNTITRTASNASPGHILLIDCDYEKFSYLKGKPLHEFLSKYIPDIFEGAAYVTTNSTSYYIKGKKSFHQYYFFKYPTDFSQLHILINKLFLHHNMATYALAKNYSRTYVKTPIDIKLHELQMPIFEYSQLRHNHLNGTDVDIEVDISYQDGLIIDAKILSLPRVDTSNAIQNHAIYLEQGNSERAIKLKEYLETHNSSDVYRDTASLERNEIPASITITASAQGKVPLRETTIIQEILHLVSTQQAPATLYQAIGEPAYAQHQTAKLFYQDPYELGSYRIVDQAHGGTTYQIVFSYEDLDSILSAASTITPINFIRLLSASNRLQPDEAGLLGQMYHRAKVIPAAKLTKSLLSSTPDIIPEESELQTNPQDIDTMMAALAKARVDLPSDMLEKIQRGLSVDAMFNADNISHIKDICYGFNRDDIMTKPGPYNDFNIAPRPKIVKHLSPLYPTTHISPHANETALDALIQKYTATNKVEDISYNSSMHGESLHFGDGRVEITYQQQVPSFERVPTAIKHTLDAMSQSTLSEFTEIYMKRSLGKIWRTISELSYMKKIDPQLKQDFLHLHLPSNAGKTFNMDVANLITPYEKTSLDQFFEQAAKLNPINIVKSTFLFHDEVKSFHHQWNELGAFYPIKQAYASDTIRTQLPLKILSSAENVMTKGTKQQFNRLLVMNPTDIEVWEDLHIKPEHEMFMVAATYKSIYDSFTSSYNKFANMPEQQALQLTKTLAASYSLSLSAKGMTITSDYILDALTSYLVQEMVDMGSSTVVPSVLCRDLGILSKYVKVFSVKDYTLYISFKKQTVSNLVDFILNETTGQIESRSMKYEALTMSWEDLGCYKLDKPKTIAGVSGFYGYCMDIRLKD